MNRFRITSGTESPPPLDHHEFGLWDAIYNAGPSTFTNQMKKATPQGVGNFSYLRIFAGIVTVLNSAKRWTPVDKQELDKVSLSIPALHLLS